MALTKLSCGRSLLRLNYSGGGDALSQWRCLTATTAARTREPDDGGGPQQQRRQWRTVGMTAAAAAATAAVVAETYRRRRTLLAEQPVEAAAADQANDTDAKGQDGTRPARDSDDMSPSEVRFRKFASIEYDGESYMTPSDFLDSMIQDRPRPRIKPKVFHDKEVKKILDATPRISKYVKKHNSKDPDFFRTFGDKGIISFPEYMFLLSIITRPKSGFRVAFDVIDTSRENSILHNEFSTFVLMASARKGVQYRDFPVESTLKTHFFGRDGKGKLTYNEFQAFIHGLQREVLLVEFLEYSRGMETMSEADFAHLLLRFADLTPEQKMMHYELMDKRLPPESERQGISFPELETFVQLLSHLEDFSLAFKLYPKAGRSMNKAEFSRAAKVSLGHGRELSPHLVDVVFALFDVAEDGALSHGEFFTVLRNRQKRRLQRRADKRAKSWPERMVKCVRKEITQSPEQRIRMDV